MASPQPHNRILRVGLLQGTRILEERHLHKPGDFTVGQDPKSTLVLPLPELPDSFPVFEYRASQYNLVINEAMQGRVNLGSSDVDFHTLRSQGMAMQRGDQYILPLQESARGVVELDKDLRLFFQFIQPLPPSEAPRLPPDLQGGSWRSMDRMFFGILAASLLLHFAGAALIIASEPPPEPELELDQLDDRFARVLMPPKPEEPRKQAADTAQAAADTEKEKPQASDSDDKPSSDTASKPASPEQAAAQRAEVVKKVSGKGLLKILGSSGGGGGGAFSDVLGGSTGGGDIAQALAGAGGVGIATEASVGANGPRGGGTGKVAGIGDLGTSGGGNVDLGSKKEVEISGRVTTSTPEVESSDVDREALARYIKTRLKAIQGCYEKELKRNPSLKGKVLVRFNILPSGRTGEIEIEENTLGSDAVASCIRTVVRGW
ncbi:MAG TPA: AgmX/PglI C-terminal domain-containing protein, partial [Cystobacter sp.]